MEIPGIPDSIPRARAIELIESLGLDAMSMLSLRFEPHAIHVEVYALKDSMRYWDGGADTRAATHMIAIPIVDEPSTHDIGQAVADAIKEYEDRRKSDPGAGPQGA